MTALLGRNTQVWKEFYEDQETKSLEEHSLAGVKTTKIILQDAPEELKGLQGKIDAFWEEYRRRHPDARRGSMYAMSGTEKVRKRDDTLEVQAYKTDYATVVMKLETGEEVTAEEQAFLQKRVMFPGVSGVIRHGDSYLAGKVAKNNIKHGLWESVPQGMVSYGAHHLRDPFHRTLAKEMHEETGLYLGNQEESSQGRDDFTVCTLQAINLGRRAGNCTLIYSLEIEEGALEKIRGSPEHSELRWVDAEEIVDPKERYAWNPVTVRLFERLRERSL